MTVVRNDSLTKRVPYGRRLTISLMFLGLLLLTMGRVVFAHKVSIFAYVDGDMVHTESYFPDGTRVKDGLIEVYDSEGQKLLHGRTDENGEFHFKPPKKDTLEIVLLASMGHRNSYTILADELPDIVMARGSRELESEDLEVGEITRVDLEEIREVIESSLDNKLKPIIQQLVKQQQRHVSFAEVIGGIGYIVGIMGIILYFVGRKDTKGKIIPRSD